MLKRFHCHKCGRYKPAWDMNQEDPTECKDCTSTQLVSPVLEIQMEAYREAEWERYQECIA